MAQLIDWALYTEQAVGRGAPSLADVINRPLREVLTVSGADPDASFGGFALAAHVHSAADVTTGTLATARGGTGLSSPTSGSLLVAAGALAMTLLAPGSAGSMVRSNGSAWAAGAVVTSDISDLATAATAITKVGTLTVGAIGSGFTAIPDSALAQLTTAGKVANSATTATALNTLSAIVARDGSGNFAAGTITANLVGSVTGAVTGNASTATALSTARSFALTGDATGSQSADLSSGVSIAVTLGAGVVQNANVGNAAAIAYTKLNLSASIVNADVSASAGIVDTKLATIQTAGKVANTATSATALNTVSTIVLRDGSGNFAAGAITATSFTGDGSALTSLNATQLATGTVASARVSGAYTGITSVGTLTAGVWNATVIGPTFGGTGQIAVAIGDLLYGSATNTWARLAGNATTTRKFLRETGDGVNPTAPAWDTLTAADIGAGTFPSGAFVFQGAVSGITTLTATTVVAALTGNATTATTLATGRTVAITGDLTYTSPTFDGSGNVTAAGTLATVNSNVGAFGSTTAIPVVTVNGKGLVTAVTTAAVVAPAGTLTGTTLASNVVTSSLTSVGTLTGLTTSGTIVSTVTSGAVINAGSATTSQIYFQLLNTSGLMGIGVESSTGGAIFSGGTAYSTVFGTTTAKSLHFATNATVRVTIDSTGNLIAGTDPGGTELMRVGGGARFSSAVTAFSVSSGKGIISSATNTFVTLFTPNAPGLFLVTAYLSSSGPTFAGTALVVFDNTTTMITRKDIGASMDFQISGTSVQAKQVSGSTLNLSFAYQLIG